MAACGIPDTLVHGDFHPGNVRGADDRLVLLDWGDCGVGHPLLDQAAFLAAIRGGRARSRASASGPGSGAPPSPAATRIAPRRCSSRSPLLRQAVVYRSFLDRIEPSERVYHASDPAHWLRRAARLTASS